MPEPSAEMQAAIAVTRFGMGARPGEMAALGDARAWLKGQIKPSGAPQPQGTFRSTAEQMVLFDEYRRLAGRNAQVRRSDTPRPAAAPDPAMAAGQPARPRRAQPTAGDLSPEAQASQTALQQSRRAIGMATGDEFLARTRLAASTPDGFAERWAQFWANWFTISATKFQSAAFCGQYEREAIRPRVFGRFADLVLAADLHPGMLLYLDQAQSIGPHSQAGQRRNAGLNENLAREAMELHTVGVDGGYSQADVTELARALTGWTINAGRLAQAGGQGVGRGPRGRATVDGRRATGDEPTRFIPFIHEPGPRTVMGKAYADEGADQARRILWDLAHRPETGRHVARRLARHFVSDDPPVALTTRLEQAFNRSGGDLTVLAETLIDSPEAWNPAPAKFKTPYEFVVSTHRALNTQPDSVRGLNATLTTFGQPAFAAPSPEGWPDDMATWAAPDAVVKRLAWARLVADAVPVEMPVRVAEQALGPRLGERSHTTIARAGDRGEALTLFLMSPEFQRR